MQKLLLELFFSTFLSDHGEISNFGLLKYAVSALIPKKSKSSIFFLFL